MRLLFICSIGVFMTFCQSPHPAQGADNTIQGAVKISAGSQPPWPLGDVPLLLEDDTGSVVQTVITDFNGQYRFEGLEPGVYWVVATNSPDAVGAEALPGSSAKRVDDNTLEVTVGGSSGAVSSANDFLKRSVTSPRVQINRVIGEGDSVPANLRPGIDQIWPTSGYPRNVTRRVTDDGSVIVLDPAGTAVLRLNSPPLPGTGPPQGRTEILIDTEAKDPVDGERLRRFHEVEVNRDGMCAFLAEREDNQEGVYRLDVSRHLARVALLSHKVGNPGAPYLTVSDSGQITYLDYPFLYQSGTATPILGPGQSVDGLPVLGLPGYPASNAAGELALSAQVSPDPSGGAGVSTLLRRRGSRWERVAWVGQSVAQEPGGSRTGPLTWLDYFYAVPQVGADGSVIFLGGGNGFVNFFIARPGEGPRPLLPAVDWSHESPPFFGQEELTNQYAISPTGAVAINARKSGSSRPALYLITPTGELREVLSGGTVWPEGRPAFSPDGRLFFLGTRAEWKSPSAYGQYSGLFRYDPDTRALVEVAVPGQSVPELSGAVIHHVPDWPVVSTNWIAFGGLFRGFPSFPSPTTGIFRVPLQATVANGPPLAWEGHGLTNDPQVNVLRDFYATVDGTVMIHAVVLRWLVGGFLIYRLPPGASRPDGAGTQSTRAAISPEQLLVTGDELGTGSGRKLLTLPKRFLYIKPERWLFLATFSDRAGKPGEGLFTVAVDPNTRKKEVQPVAVMGESPQGHSDLQFAGLADDNLNPPSVSADGNVVFKARLQGRNGPLFGLFQWTGLTVTSVGSPSQDAATLAGWAAGLGGRAYFLEWLPSHLGASPSLRLYEQTSSGPIALVETGKTIIEEPRALLTNVSQLMVNGAGQLFFKGEVSPTPGNSFSGIFHVDRNGQEARVETLVREWDRIPERLDGNRYRNPLLFDGDFLLRRESACRELYFVADVGKPTASQPETRGFFSRDSAGKPITLLVAGLKVVGERDVRIEFIPGEASCDSQARGLSISQAQPRVNWLLAFSTRTSDGRWAIYRLRSIRDQNGVTSISSALIAKEGQTLPDGLILQGLDRPDWFPNPNEGPAFTLNDLGEVVFLAYVSEPNVSVRQALYRYSDTGP